MNFDKKIENYRAIISESKMDQMFIDAALHSLPNDCSDNRSFWLAAVGIRHDGCKVLSRNGNCNFAETMKRYQKIPINHAEGRLVKKMGKEGTIYVARISRMDGSFAMAKPCHMCSVIIKARSISKVYYSVNNTQYGVWYPQTDKDRIFNI